MKCPWCGSPVMVRGKRWECGYCGDSGILSSPQQETEQPREVTLTFSLSFEQKIDFPETWSKMKDVLQAVAPQQYAKLLPLLQSVFLYEISYAMSIPGHTVDNEKFYQLDQFLQSNSDFQAGPNIRDIIHAAKHDTILCEAQGKLADEFCGSFWQTLIVQMKDEGLLDTVNDLFWELGHLYEYFVCDDPDGQNYDRKSALEDAFELHWYWNRYFHPDVTAATVRLCSDDTSCIDDDCRDILVSAFPDYFRSYSLDDLQYIQWNCLLKDLSMDDPKLAASMWETLLSTAGPDFSTNPEVGDYLLENDPFAEDD